MSIENQNHSGSGDNVGGNKILNLSVPKILVLGIIVLLSIIAFVYWKSSKERFYFNEDKIDLAVTVIDSMQIRGLNEKEASQYKADEIVYYDVASENDTISIFTNSSYLSKFANNEIIGNEVNLYSLVPKINFKVTNNSNKTVFFSKIVLEIKSSKIDPVPIPVFFANECYEGFSSDNFFKTFNLPIPNFNENVENPFTTNVLPLAIYNEGSSPMKNVKIDFDIEKQKAKNQHTFNNLPYSINFPEIDSESFIDIFPYLRKQGVDVDRIIAISASNQNYSNDRILIENGLGKYTINRETGELYVFLNGLISYNDINGKKYKNKFSTPISVLRYWGCGAVSLENGVYDISLCPTGENYEITYPISNYIKTSEVDNFSIQLNCPKSSIHKIVAKLYYSENKYVQKNINYHLIVPRRMVQDEVVIFKGNGKCKND